MSKDKSEIESSFDVQVLQAMIGFKPVGISKHFQMSCIVEKLQESSDKPISSKIVWDLLNKWYNLKQLDENEIVPFQNQEIDFNLPETEYGPLKQKKITQAVKPVLEKQNIPVVTNQMQQQSVKSPTPTLITQVKKSEVNPIKEKDNIIKPAIVTTQKDEIKKEPSAVVSSDKNITKSISTPRRDSQSKDVTLQSTPKTSNHPKKETPSQSSSKKSIDKRSSQQKSRSSSTHTPSNQPVSSSKNEEKPRESVKDKQREDVISSKRTTRGSLKPDEINIEHSKSQSPLTVTNTPSSSSTGSAPKRRRI